METIMKTSIKNNTRRKDVLSNNAFENKLKKGDGNSLSRADLSNLIQIKKDRSIKYAQQSFMFFYIGLVVSLLMIIVAFDWKFYDNGSVVNLLGDESSSFEQIIDIPVTKQPPPPPQLTIQQPKIVEVSDEVIIEEVEVEMDVEMTEGMVVAVLDFEPEPIEEEETEEIFFVVENQPSPIGGYKTFYKYVTENLNYPNMAARRGIEGRVYLQFVVGKDGVISDITLLKGIDNACDAEAIKVIQNAPKWNPGKQRGNPVNVYMTIPIFFTLKKPMG